MDYRKYFKNKKITMLGLGVLGRGVNVAKFLADRGAVLTITDLKTKEELASSVRKLHKYKNIHFVLGGHRISDFKNADMIIKGAGVPLDSPYIKEAIKNKIPVEMDASLFARLAPKGVVVVGVTGTRGKSTVTHLVHHIAKTAGKRAHIGGNVLGLATLPLLKKAKAGDIVILELDSWQLQGFGDVKISPHIAVFTNFLRDHMNYYKGNMARYFKDKSNIFKHQKKEDLFIMGENMKKNLTAALSAPTTKLLSSRSTKCVARKSDVPKSWKTRLAGTHNAENIAAAVAVCRALGIPGKIIKKAVESFRGVPGRLEYIRTVKGVRYYNDTTSTTPDALKAALNALDAETKKRPARRRIILIAGGNDKELEFEDIAKFISKTAKTLVLMKGTATDKILKALPKKSLCPAAIASSMKEAVAAAQKSAVSGDIILLSPGAASFGVFKNEFDRGDQFVKNVMRDKT